MKVKSILTILDKPKDEPLAFESAAELHYKTGARLECAAFTWHHLAEANVIFTTKQCKKMYKQLVQARTAEAQDMLDGMGEAGSSARLQTVWSYDLADWVAKNYKKNPVDLVVKTVHKSKTLLHTPLDWELLRKSPAPVLLTSGAKRRRSGNILAAIDLRHADQKHRRLNLRVLNAARYMAGLYDADVHVVSVTEMSQVLHDLEIINERALARKSREKTRPRLQTLLSPYKIPEKRIHQPVGKLGPAISTLARRLRADLLVVGSSAHRIKQSAGLGNSAEKILSHAPCDVLSVRP